MSVSLFPATVHLEIASSLWEVLENALISPQSFQTVMTFSNHVVFLILTDKSLLPPIVLQVDLNQDIQRQYLLTKDFWLILVFQIKT